MENIKQIVEAIIFASGESIKKQDLIDKIPALTKSDLQQIVDELKEKFNTENSGIVLLDFNEQLQFSTNAKCGDFVAEVLTPLREKQLSKSLLEILSTIAYKQPITKLELDEIRGVSSDYALSGLLKAKLVEVVGRKDSVGRPLLYGTTDEFLKKFDLQSIEDLPDVEEVLEKIQMIYQPSQSTLFHNRSILDEDGEPTIDVIGALKNLDEQKQNISLFDLQEVASDVDDLDEIPDFLKDEEIQVIE